MPKCLWMVSAHWNLSKILQFHIVHRSHILILVLTVLHSHQLVKPIFHKLLIIIVMIVTITIRSIDNTFAQDISYYRCSHHQYNAHTWFWLVLQGPVCQSDQGFPDMIKTKIYDWLTSNKSTAWVNRLPTFGNATTGFPAINDVWETSTEIPYWWRVTAQIWVVTHPSMEFLSLFLFGRETSGSIAKCWLFS